jgi:hypothetical protein
MAIAKLAAAKVGREREGRFNGLRLALSSEEAPARVRIPHVACFQFTSVWYANTLRRAAILKRETFNPMTVVNLLFLLDC